MQIQTIIGRNTRCYKASQAQLASLRLNVTVILIFFPPETELYVSCLWFYSALENLLLFSEEAASHRNAEWKNPQN